MITAFEIGKGRELKMHASPFSCRPGSAEDGPPWNSQNHAKFMKVVFKGPYGPLIKDLDAEILVNDNIASDAHRD